MTAARAPLNYTTSIEASKTAGECLGILSRHRAMRVSVDYDEDGEPTGVSFIMGTRFGPRHFSLPVPVEGTMARLREAYAKGGTGVQQRHLTREHARRVEDAAALLRPPHGQATRPHHHPGAGPAVDAGHHRPAARRVGLLGARRVRALARVHQQAAVNLPAGPP